MKRKNIFIGLALMLMLPFALIFTGCGNKEKEDSAKLPSSNYEKVVFAFNGVEKSFKDSSKKTDIEKIDTDSVNSLLGFSVNSSSNALTTINNLYTSGDSQGDVIDDLEYDQPPMIQFQYIKSALERIGENYSFGTKYYYDITNTIYADLEAGEKKQSSDGNEYRYDYTFRFAIEINIDSNDLITVDVSFNIDLVQGTETITTDWYVGMHLDYDMKNTTPNYTLDMMTSNYGVDHLYVLENDYVQVSNNKIKEWRKFLIESNTELKKDSTHQTFDSYIGEGVDYTVDTVKWYKNSNLRKITQMTESKKQTIAKALFNYGLNRTDINSKEFIDKAGTQNVVMKNIYDDISEIWGDDIIYDLILDEYEHQPDGNGGSNTGEDINSYTGINVQYDQYNNFDDGNFIVKNVTAQELFSDNKAWKDYNKERYVLPKLYWKKNNAVMGEVQDLSNAQFYIGTRLLSSTDKIGDIYTSIGSPENFTIKIVIGNLETHILARCDLEEIVALAIRKDNNSQGWERCNRVVTNATFLGLLTDFKVWENQQLPELYYHYKSGRFSKQIPESEYNSMRFSVININTDEEVYANSPTDTVYSLIQSLGIQPDGNGIYANFSIKITDNIYKVSGLMEEVIFDVEELKQFNDDEPENNYDEPENNNDENDSNIEEETYYFVTIYIETGANEDLVNDKEDIARFVASIFNKEFEELNYYIDYGEKTMLCIEIEGVSSMTDFNKQEEALRVQIEGRGYQLNSLYFDD